MTRRCVILLNRRAGALHATAGEEQLAALIAEIGLQAEIQMTSSPEEMSRTVRKLVAEKTDVVAIAGGDGTVALAVQELAKSDSVLGIIPQGTANNFATALRLPQDLPSAVRVLKEGAVREVDLGLVDGRYFTEAAGVGLFADALALYGAGTNKNFFRGLYATLKVIFSAKAQRLMLTIDGEPQVERAVMCTVSNTYRMGYALPLAPGAKVTDGELDVVIVGNLSRSEILPHYRAIRAQMHTTLPKVTMMRASKVRIDARRRMNVHCDDRVIGSTPATFAVQPGALKVLAENL